MEHIDEPKSAIKILESLEGLGKEFIILSEDDKKIISGLREGGNIINCGVTEALSRDITIAFSHNEKFRKPPCAIVLLSSGGKIVGEMTGAGKRFYNGTKEVDAYVLPPVPFYELEKSFASVCSASPGYEADKFLRTLIKVEKNGATLLVGFDFKR